MENVDRNSICRLCLLGGDDLSSIFEANVVNGLIVADLIKDLLQFQVSINDGYPHLVCRICLSKLNEFLHFKRQCQTSRITYDNVFSPCEKASDFSTPVKDNRFNERQHERIQDVDSQFGVIKSEKEEVTINEEQLNYESEGSEKMTAYADDASNQMEMIAVKDEPLDSSCDEEQIKSHTVIKAEPEDQEDMPYESSFSPIHMVQTSFGGQQQVEGEESTRFVETIKGRRKLLHSGYAYVVDRRRGVLTYWRCEKRRGCSGRLKTVEDVVQGTPSHHNHPPDAARIIALRCINRIKQLAGETAEATNAIIQSCTQEFPISAVGSLPKKETLAKMIRRKRTAMDSEMSCHDNASRSDDSLHINLLHSSCEEDKINLYDQLPYR